MATAAIRSDVNTLEYHPDKCINCGMCIAVCPHAVFAPNGKAIQIVRHEACMECGACQVNCPTGAIVVDSGVGCAAAMIYAALIGRDEPVCGPEPAPSCGSDPEPDGGSCCGTSTLCCG
jgi:NAD-dependent dihydropyrimidine dehydrogenase PreA subunit